MSMSTASTFTYIEDIARHEGQTVAIRGWLHQRRSSGKIHFLVVRDGTGFIQAVMSKAAVGDDLFKAADHLSQETSIIVTGTARADLLIDQLRTRVDNHQTPGKLVNSYGKRRGLAGLSFPFSVRRQ